MVIEWKNGPIPFGPPLDTRVTDETVKTYTLKLGLILLDEFGASEYHYAMIFRKFS